jgi:hypothetical protein
MIQKRKAPNQEGFGGFGKYVGEEFLTRGDFEGRKAGMTV